ncbi:MAG: radical SAM protein [Pirellulaceae bacterium]|nr:radical SAM protein [Pirellulaceae bacterium]
MRYSGTVIRPPSEADSYILQITYGCSHNRCTFCGTYPDKPFQVRPFDEVREDIALARRVLPATRRVFLADGNAMVLSPSRLIPILDALAAAFPDLQRVSVYANARDLLQKSRDDLRQLRERGLRLVYLGLESGHDEVLRRINKGSTAAEMIEAVRHAQAEELRVSVIGLLGIGGTELSAEHAEATGRAVSAMDPRYLSMLTLMLVPGTPLHQQWREGAFQPLEPEALLSELRQVISHLDGLAGCIFRTNHASNYLPLAGTLPKDKPRLLATLDAAIRGGRSGLRPEAWRAL